MPIRRAVSALLCTVVLGTFASVPLMDGIAAEYGPVIESEHGSCNYVRIHDHAICVQFGDNAPSTTPFPRHLSPTPPVRHLALPTEDAGQKLRLPDLLQRTRAPPPA